MEIKNIKIKKIPKVKKEKKTQEEILPKKVFVEEIESVVVLEDTPKDTENNIKKVEERIPIKSKILLIFAFFLFIVSFYILYQNNFFKKVAEVNVETQRQVLMDDRQVLTQLKTIILLPDDVTPTMAIINDADILKQKQPGFFMNAKNGDRLIIYPELAIIYDQVANKIIKIGSVQTTSTTSSNVKTIK